MFSSFEVFFKQNHSILRETVSQLLFMTSICLSIHIQYFSIVQAIPVEPIFFLGLAWMQYFKVTQQLQLQGLGGC